MIAQNITVEEWESMQNRLESLLGDIQGLQDDLAYHQEEIETTEEARLNFFLLVAGFNILLMQAGFALLEVGTVQAKNAKSILFKNIVDMCTGVLLWWFLRFEFSRSGLIGFRVSHIAVVSSSEAVFFFHSFTYSTTCATIISGGVAERISFAAYMGIAAFMVGFVYPIMAFWAWSENGFLYKLGYTDFAGAGVIHALGGFATVFTAWKLGPRIGRFNKDEETGQIEVHPIKGHSPVLASLGVFILLFGWFCFNASSTQGADMEHFRLSARAAVNTILSAAAASLFGILWRQWETGVHDLDAVHNTLLCGAVAITGCCAYVDFWAAPIIGLVSTFFYHFASRLSMSLHIDDPLDAFAVHGGGGVWGVIAIAFFANPDYLDEGRPAGLIFGGGGRIVAAQLVGLMMLLGWGGVLFAGYITLLNRVRGFHLRADKDAELLGLDFAYHDGFAYPDFNKNNVLTFNEMKAAERRVEARNKGRKQALRKVNDLTSAIKKKKRKKRRNVDGESISGSTSASSTHSKSTNSKGYESAESTKTNSVGGAEKKASPLISKKIDEDKPFQRLSFEDEATGPCKPYSQIPSFGGNSLIPGSFVPHTTKPLNNIQLQGKSSLTVPPAESSSGHGLNPMILAHEDKDNEILNPLPTYENPKPTTPGQTGHEIL